MSIDKFLDFLFKHNVVIIEGLFVFILLLISALAFYYFFSASKTGTITGKLTTSDSDIEKLQVALKQVLEKANIVTSTSLASTVSDNSTASVDASTSQGSDLGNQILSLQQEIGVLKDSLSQKQKEIENYKNDSIKRTELPASADPSQGGLEDQIKELQAKLTEYEIISQDIADLTMYKDENVKLKWELSKLKGENPKVEASVNSLPKDQTETKTKTEDKPEDKSASEPKIEAASEAPVLETVNPETATVAPIEVAQQASADEPANSPQASAEEVKGVVDDVLMAEFAAAVEEQNKGKTVNHNQSKTSDPIKKETEESKIMDQFEKFVKKEGAS